MSVFFYAPNSLAEKRIALLIANEGYEQSGAILQQPMSDAELMAKALRQYDFVLFDNKIHHDLGKDEFKTRLLAFAKAAKGAEVALVYYAGHGLQDKQVNYLVPIDANIRSPAQIEDQSVNLQLVVTHLKEAQTRLNLIFLDTCRDNPFGAGRSWGRASSFDIPKFQDELTAPIKTRYSNLLACAFL